MKTSAHSASGSHLLRLNAARLHARIASRLSNASARITTSLTSTSTASGSPWSSLRLDLFKTPLTHYRE